ncbi:hypothetical protein LEP1GSC047_3086 [Leptospira inadai serovar Lyme str. 10]|uniref:Uncharacterized protein n=2 Tax=Leptospira inadai serovar Lyme TaxID=293084 RepID=V6HJ50_9LEPT|nr:hypothetical protein [Leptospira inadai]EQA36830.1 hypothetical protein LEP1GSC047_3086 [Leptospira inadai serovar Lyme str. 10]PNV74598.1 hypothetical protein BES34_012725 [Leptospira inadai serovar Lyme]
MLNFQNHFDVPTLLFLCISILYAGHGFIHQLIVGGAISVFQHPDERQSRLILMIWIATGGFMSFLGLLPTTLLLLFGPEPAPVKAALWTNFIALGFLAFHSIICGLKQLPKPLRVGFYFTLAFAVAHLAFLILQGKI